MKCLSLIYLYKLTHPCDCLQQHLDLPDLDELQDPHGGEEVLPGLLAVGVLQQSLRILVHLFRIDWSVCMFEHIVYG